MLYSNNGDFLPGSEGRSQAGCSSGDETAKKKSHRVQTLHVWTFGGRSQAAEEDVVDDEEDTKQQLMEE